MKNAQFSFAAPEFSSFEVLANANCATVLVEESDTENFLKIMPLSLKAILVKITSAGNKMVFTFACSKEEYFAKFSRSDYYKLCVQSIA